MEELLRFNGFSIRREDGLLSASKGSIRVLVRIEGDLETLTGTYIEEVRRAAEQKGHDRILIIHTGNVAQEARGLLDKYRIVLWDRERLSLELGRALLAAAEGEAPGPELPFIDYLLVEPRVSAGAVLADAVAATGDGPGAAPAPPVVEASFARSRPPAVEGQSDILSFVGMDEAAMRAHEVEDRYGEVRLEPAEAMERAPRLRTASRCDLQYIPYHLFDYQVELEDEGGDAVVRDNGTLAVNALTGQAQDWNIAPVFAASPPGEEDAAVLRPTIDGMAAYEQANRAVKELHTRSVERVEERGTVTVFVKHHVRPRDGALDIRARGLVYMPVWCIEAAEGVAIVSANTGRIVKEEYLD